MRPGWESILFASMRSMRRGEPAGFQRKPYSGVFVMLALVEYCESNGRGGVSRRIAKPVLAH